MKVLNLVMLIDDNDADNEYHERVIANSEIANRLQTITSSTAALMYFASCFKDENVVPVPDLVFLDINMPGLNGFELLDKLRGLPDPYKQRQKMKIFMLTGSLNPDDYNLANTGYRDLLSGFRIKPLTDTIFLKIVQTYF